MDRTSPPRCRARLLAVAAVLAASTALPASVAGAQTAAVATPVTQRHGLVVTGLDVSGAVKVAVTDAQGAVARWDATADGGTVAVDAWAPHSGGIPANGAGTVSVTAGDQALITAPVVLDITPATPALTATVDGSAVVARWGAVEGPAGVTYQLQRGAGGSWSGVYDGPSTDAVRDVLGQPGTYEYQVTAAVAGANGINRSAPDTVAIEVIAPQPTLQPTPATAPEKAPAKEHTSGPAPAPSVAAPEAAASEQRSAPREGRTRRSAAPERRSPAAVDAATPVRAAGAPAGVRTVGGGIRWEAAPTIAMTAAVAPAPEVAPPMAGEEGLPPAGKLTVQAAAMLTRRGPVTGAAAVLITIFTIAALLRRSRGESSGPEARARA